MICETRLETGDNKGMACHKRSCIYETWCDTCKRRDESKAIEEGRNPETVTLFKYVGETSRSAYERGKNHLDDNRLISTKSHMLKHFLTSHKDEPPMEMTFRMRILGFS